jgi:hypothetical protein
MNISQLLTCYEENGTVDFLALPNNQLLQRYEVKALQGQQATAAYRDGMSHVIVIGTAGGSVIPLRLSFSTQSQAGKRVIVPEVKEGKPLQLDPQGRAITQLVHREEEGKIATAALLGPRTLIFLAQEEKTSLLGESSVEELRSDLSSVLKADATALALDKYRVNLIAGTEAGELASLGPD